MPLTNERNRRRVRQSLGCTGCVVALALLSAGCAATMGARTAALQTAQQTLAATDAALGAYEALQTVCDDSTYNHGYLKIVLAPQPDAVDFTAVADADMSDLLALRMRACNQVKAAAEHLRTACSAAARAEAMQSYAAVVEALRGFSNDKTANAEFKRVAAALPQDLSLLWQTGRIRQARRALVAAAAELAALWAHEYATWSDYVEDAYITGYAAGLLSLRSDSFDDKELAKQINEPYGIRTKAGLFKLKKYHEAARAAAKIKMRLRLATEALNQVALPAPTAIVK